MKEKPDWYRPKANSKDDKFMTETGDAAQVQKWSFIFEGVLLLAFFVITILWNWIMN